MMPDKPKADDFKEQLQALIEEYSSAIEKSKYSDASDVLSHSQAVDLKTRFVAAIDRISGRSSVYFEQVVETNEGAKDSPHYCLKELSGVARSLLHDIENGYLASAREILLGDVFSDYLEMASHLCSVGYKDAAAVVAGSTLEVHLRALCERNGVETRRRGKPKRADAMNADLAKVGAFTKLDQKNVSAWLGLRNSAAHGKYEDYGKPQVALLIDGIRDFVTRHPA